MSLSVIPLTILGQITGVTGSGDTALYQVSFKSIDGTPLYGVTAVWTDEQAEIEALAAEKPYGVWINPIDGVFTVKFADYTYVGTADLIDADVLAGVTLIEFITTEVSDRLLPVPTSDDVDKCLIINQSTKEWEIGYLEPFRIEPAAHAGDILFTDDNNVVKWGERNIIVFTNSGIQNDINQSMMTMLPTIISTGTATANISYTESDTDKCEPLIRAIESAILHISSSDILKRADMFALGVFQGIVTVSSVSGIINPQVSLELVLYYNTDYIRMTMVAEKTSETTAAIHLRGEKLS